VVAINAGLIEPLTSRVRRRKTSRPQVEEVSGVTSSSLRFGEPAIRTTRRFRCEVQ
jgi:hypothetical protein